jgi:CRP-like cAMP-binding protein
MLSGYAIRHKIVAGGARQIVAVHMKGDIVDLQNSFLGVADHSVQMLTDSEVAFIPREAVKKLGLSVRTSAWQCGMTHLSMDRFFASGLPTSDAATLIRVSRTFCARFPFG